MKSVKMMMKSLWTGILLWTVQAAFLIPISLSHDEYWESFNITKGPLVCSTVVHKWEPELHKSLYRVGVYASEGDEVAVDMYGTLFAEYLTETAGQRWNPPVQFELVPVTLTSLREMATSEQVDFLFSSSAVFSCIATEFGAEALATIINRRQSRGHEYDLDVYGGVMFVLKDNKDINTIHDFRGRTVGAGSITAMGSGQTQFYELYRQGISFVADLKQVIFTKDERLVVQGLLDGDFEIAFSRTDQIERHTLENGQRLDADAFKIINPQTHTLFDGKLFPFVSSTGLHPEWPVAALPHVDPTMARKVQEALLAIRDHAYSIPFEEELRCDTTDRIAQLARQATRDGSFVGFRTARSYFQVRTKQEGAGFIRHDEEYGDWRCINGDTLYDDIHCPPSYYKVTREEFEVSCAMKGLECKEGYECFCQPCIKAFEVDVYQHSKDGVYEQNNETSIKSYQGCAKMSLCGTVQQRHEIVFHLVDNRERDNPEIEVVMHLRNTDVRVNASQLEPYVYEVVWSDEQEGVAIMEISFNGEQIPESPLRVQVTERNCQADIGKGGFTPNAVGECVCGENRVEIRGECIPVAIFAVVASVAFFVIMAIATLLYIRHRINKSDELWKIDAHELHLDDPVEVIGQGSFGVVLLAEYRGTKVAIKRVLRTKGRPNGSSWKRRRARRKRIVENAGIAAMSLNDGLESAATLRSQGNSVAAIDPASKEDTRHFRGNRSGNLIVDEQGYESESAFLPSMNGMSRHFSVDFLTRDMDATKSKWASIFPWSRTQDIAAQAIHDEIFGSESGRSLTKTINQLLCPCFSSSHQQREEFKAEMRTLARLRHPCICTLMGAVVTPHRDPIMVMEYLDFGSLHDLIRNSTMYLTGEIILQVTRDLAQGLRFLHGSAPPILHGDLKSRNILIDGRFRAKLCDFGLSTKRTSKITGTPYWLPPEYLTGSSQYNTTCDMYSVGIIFWEIYARSSPYLGENYKEVIRGICNRRVNKRPQIPLEAPPKFVDLMQKCWSPDPSYRPQARSLDVMLTEMSAADAEPLAERDGERTGKDPYDNFPKHVAEALLEGKTVPPETHDIVSVAFANIVSFDEITRHMEPEKVRDMLDRLYVKFDYCAKKHSVFKVQTNGNAWMGVTNLEGDQNRTHAKDIAEYATDMVNEANTVLIDKKDASQGYVNIRVGFHSGSIVSNVIGSSTKRFCLFGETVNTASRIESIATCNRILCSERSYRLLREQAPNMQTKRRGNIEVKGKGAMRVYWIGDDLLNARKGTLEAAQKSVEFDLSMLESEDNGMTLSEPSDELLEASNNGEDAVMDTTNGEMEQSTEAKNDVAITPNEAETPAKDSAVSMHY